MSLAEQLRYHRNQLEQYINLEIRLYESNFEQWILEFMLYQDNYSDTFIKWNTVIDKMENRLSYIYNTYTKIDETNVLATFIKNSTLKDNFMVVHSANVHNDKTHYFVIKKYKINYSFELTDEKKHQFESYFIENTKRGLNMNYLKCSNNGYCTSIHLFTEIHVDLFSLVQWLTAEGLQVLLTGNESKKQFHLKIVIPD